jgi:hypothetical protein
MKQVQAVLLLLGGREIPPGMSGANMSYHHHHKVQQTFHLSLGWFGRWREIALLWTCTKVSSMEA